MNHFDLIMFLLLDISSKHNVFVALPSLSLSFHVSLNSKFLKLTLVELFFLIMFLLEVKNEYFWCLCVFKNTSL